MGIDIYVMGVGFQFTAIAVALEMAGIVEGFVYRCGTAITPWKFNHRC